MKDLKLLDSVKIQLKNKQSLTKIDEGLQADVQMKKYQIYELPYKDLYYAIKVFKEATSQEERIGEVQASQKIKSKYIIVYVCHDQEKFEWILYEKFGDYNLQQYLQYFKLEQYTQNNYHSIMCLINLLIAMCITLTIFLLKLLKDIMTFYRLDIMVQYLCNYLYHCDLKTANVLVNSSTLNIKICDLGFANQIQQKINCRRGSRGYFAPEFFQDDVISLNEKTEVFALGVILYQLLTNEFPYTNQNNCLKWISITKSNWKDFWKNKRIHQQYKEIIQNIFEMDPNKRCNINYLQNIFHF